MPQQHRFAETRVLITAGAAGIGRAMADAFAAEGARVAVCDVDAAALSDFASAHPDAIRSAADVTDEELMEVFVGDVTQAWGGVDVVVANAGTGGPAGPIESLDMRDVTDCIGINLHGAFLTAKLTAPVLRSQGAGLLLFMSSSAGLHGYPNRTPYAAAKWGVIGLMKSLAVELGTAGVRVNAICPGAVEGPRMDRVVANEAAATNRAEADIRAAYTESTAMKTWVTTAEIADAALFLASEAGVKVSGQALSVDGYTTSLA